MFHLNRKHQKVLAILVVLPLLMGASLTHCDGKPHPDKDGIPTPAPNPDRKAGEPGRTPEIGPTPRGPIPTDPRPEDKHEWLWVVTWTPAALFVLVSGPGIPFRTSRKGGQHDESGSNYGRKEIKVDSSWTKESNDNTRTPPGILRCKIIVDGEVEDEEQDEGPGGEVHCLAWTE